MLTQQKLLSILIALLLAHYSEGFTSASRGRSSLELHAKRAKKTRAVAKVPSASGEGGVVGGGFGGGEGLGGSSINGMASREGSGMVMDVNAFASSTAPVNFAAGPRDSKLSPLKGTIDARIAEFENKSGLERAIAEYTAPTPAGTEPKTVKLMKQVTWVAVIILVLTEIVVSVKVGGAPFDLGKVSVPSLPNFGMFTGGAGPPPAQAPDVAPAP